jgi:hypothetical protein
MDVTCYGIRINSPTKKQAAAFRRTLRYLKRAEPRAFRKVTRHLKIIVVVPRQGYANESFVARRLWITEGSILQGTIPHYLASLLLHEAQHIAQFRAGKPYRGATAEQEAYKVQRALLRHLGQRWAVEWLDAQYKSQWWRSMDRDSGSHRRFIRDLTILDTHSKPLYRRPVQLTFADGKQSLG